MNNKGFAVSTILYTILICFILFLGAAMAMFSSSNYLTVSANDDLINGTAFSATSIAMSDASGNQLSDVYIKVNSRYGIAFWPRDFSNNKAKNITASNHDINSGSVSFTDSITGQKIECEKRVTGSEINYWCSSPN